MFWYALMQVPTRGMSALSALDTPEGQQNTHLQRYDDRAKKRGASTQGAVYPADPRVLHRSWWCV